MKIKPEHIASEINHRLQVLIIDFEIFMKSSHTADDESVQSVLKQLSSLKETFIKIKNEESLASQDLENCRLIVDDIIDKMLKIKTKNPAEKNEKMAILNQIYNLRELLFVKNK
jgi:predicted RND superfamily exporter protein